MNNKTVDLNSKTPNNNNGAKNQSLNNSRHQSANNTPNNMSNNNNNNSKNNSNMMIHGNDNSNHSTSSLSNNNNNNHSSKKETPPKGFKPPKTHSNHPKLDPLMIATSQQQTSAAANQPTPILSPTLAVNFAQNLAAMADPANQTLLPFLLALQNQALSMSSFTNPAEDLLSPNTSKNIVNNNNNNRPQPEQPKPSVSKKRKTFDPVEPGNQAQSTASNHSHNNNQPPMFKSNLNNSLQLPHKAPKSKLFKKDSSFGGEPMSTSQASQKFENNATDFYNIFDVIQESQRHNRASDIDELVTSLGGHNHQQLLSGNNSNNIVNNNNINIKKNKPMPVMNVNTGGNEVNFNDYETSNEYKWHQLRIKQEEDQLREQLNAYNLTRKSTNTPGPSTSANVAISSSSSSNPGATNKTNTHKKMSMKSNIDPMQISPQQLTSMNMMPQMPQKKMLQNQQQSQLGANNKPKKPMINVSGSSSKEQMDTIFTPVINTANNEPVKKSKLSPMSLMVNNESVFPVGGGHKSGNRSKSSSISPNNVNVTSAAAVASTPTATTATIGSSVNSNEQSMTIIGTAVEVVEVGANQLWICPSCNKSDESKPMIGCDSCDDWYHWLVKVFNKRQVC